MKQVIIINNALHLPVGKLASQVAHASIASFLQGTERAQQIWLANGMAKIILKARDEKDLHDLHKLAIGLGLPTSLIDDDGRTVVAAGTITCLGIGPAEDDEIDKVTGGLKLL